MSISVLVPVLGRPANAGPVLASLRTTSDADLWFICSAWDIEQIQAVWAAVENDRENGGSSDVLVCEWQPQHDYARKMNLGYFASDGDWILLGSDDITFEPGWDTELLRVAAETGKRVIGSNDKANRVVQQGVFSTHTLVARSYVEELGGSLDGPGLIVSEAYDHNFVDRELAGLALARNEWAFAPNAVIRHHHPAFGGAKPDDTYTKGRGTFFEDQLLFWERAERWGYVGLLPQEMSLIRRSERRRLGTARARKERQR